MSNLKSWQRAIRSIGKRFRLSMNNGKTVFVDGEELHLMALQENDRDRIELMNVGAVIEDSAEQTWERIE